MPIEIRLHIVASSRDVIHSWAVPSAGIKIDCVPGRSTHHTFFVDNVGFYYGQCAEICGRYHHHMPIRICALPFEHFLVWWYSFGLPKLLYTKQKRRIETTYGFNKYVW
jgi:heme/copper-type cytochrome/quinol oxidase subunit 2